MAIRFSLKQLLLAITLLALLLVLLAPIRGVFSPFYYEQFNAVQRRLESIPGLKITGSWQHQDMWLEDCGFDVKVDGSTTSITFTDRQDWVRLFDYVEGIRFHNGPRKRFVSRQQLRDAGFQIEGLTDILGNLKAIQQFCSNAEGPKFDRPGLQPDDYRNYLKWVKITDELPLDAR